MDSKGATWFQTEIEQYPKSRDHKNNLLQFLDRVKSLSAKEKNEILPKLDFEPMFSVLIKWNNPVFAEPFLELVNVVFDYLEVSKIISSNEDLLLKFYNHVNKEFKTVLFDLLNRAIQKGQVSCFAKVPTLMYELVRSICEDADSESPVMQLLEKLISTPDGASVVFGSDMGQWLSEMCENSEVRFQIFELALKVACESKENLVLVKSSNILDELVSGLQGAKSHVDQSGFAATVECYSRLGVTPWGYEELLASGILAKLEARVVDYGPGTMEDKVMPAVYSFFGKIFGAFPERATIDCPKVVPTVINLIEVSIDRAYVTRTEMEMIGMVSVKPEGKRYLSSLGTSFTAVLLHLKTFIFSNSSGDKICALETLENLISLEDNFKNEEMLILTRSWFETIFTSVKQLVEFCQEPFPGVKRTVIPIFVSETVQCRNAGLKLLLTLTSLSWGRSEILQQPELLRWLAEGEESVDVHFCCGGVPNSEVLQHKQEIVGILLKDSTLSADSRQLLQKLDKGLMASTEVQVKRMKCS